jgi:ABC-type branched-subunit amino acid transport system substrate-binding protein
MKILSPLGFIRIFALGFVALFISACDVPVMNTTTTVDPTKPVIVALMVPYASGDSLNDQLASNLVNAAKMARNDVSGAVIDLRIYHTGANAERAAVEATRAIDEGAQIIIGPLFSTATSSVATVAAQRNINVLSFSNNAAIAGGNIYIMGVTFEDIATRLFRHAVANGLPNVGVVYPEGVEGEAGHQAAINAARNSGAILAGVASYPLNMQGLSEAAPAVAEVMASNRVQALLFTDTPTRGLPFIAAALGSEGITRRNTQFLGLARWDTSVELLNQPSMQDGLFAVPDPVLSAQFDARYMGVYGSEPHNLAALAYDAVAAVGAMIASAKAQGVDDTFSAARLTNPAGFVGVNGIFRFTSGGLNQRGLAILKVDHGDAVIVEAAPRSFGGLGF